MHQVQKVAATILQAATEVDQEATQMEDDQVASLVAQAHSWAMEDPGGGGQCQGLTQIYL